ncbi:MAG: hypothetical protein AAF550_05355 [Myxococcota bacterium]
MADSVEEVVRPIRLVGPLTAADAELSGLAWYDDALVLLPQYPQKLGGHLFSVAKSELERAVRGEVTHVSPTPIPLEMPRELPQIPGYEGFEAIAFRGRDVYLLVESEVGGTTAGHLMRGRVESDEAGLAIHIDRYPWIKLEPQSSIGNLAYEAMVVSGDGVFVFYEENGQNNPDPRALVFDHQLRLRKPVTMERLEYRLTDATSIDSSKRFWTTNFYWEGAHWKPGPCRLQMRHGTGASHRARETVERLVELQVDASSIAPSGRAPILLQLEEHSRNWEGIARLGAGFLLVTDEHPTSLLGYVEPSTETQTSQN